MQSSQARRSEKLHDFYALDFLVCLAILTLYGDDAAAYTKQTHSMRLCVYIYMEIVCRLWRGLYDGCHPVFLRNSHIVNATGLSLVAHVWANWKFTGVKFPLNWATST